MSQLTLREKSNATTIGRGLVASYEIVPERVGLFWHTHTDAHAYLLTYLPRTHTGWVATEPCIRNTALGSETFALYCISRSQPAKKILAYMKEPKLYRTMLLGGKTRNKSLITKTADLNERHLHARAHYNGRTSSRLLDIILL